MSQKHQIKQYMNMPQSRIYNLYRKKNYDWMPIEKTLCLQVADYGDEEEDDNELQVLSKMKAKQDLLAQVIQEMKTRYLNYEKHVIEQIANFEEVVKVEINEDQDARQKDFDKIGK